MLRRSLVTTLAAVMVLATVGSPAASQDRLPEACPEGADATGFTDVGSDSVHADAIRCGVARGILQGVSATSFDPAGAVTRGQFASLLVRTLDELNLPLPPAAGTARFPDAGATHGEAITRLTAAGIVTGRADGSFGPGQTINRAQLASLLVRTWSFVRGEAVQPTSTGTFDDVASGVHSANIDAAAELGLLRGRTAAIFEPAGTTRRDQAATAVVRLLGAARAQLVGEIWSLDQGTDRIHVYSGADSTESTTIDVSPGTLRAAGFDAAPTGERTVPHMIEFDSQERYAFIAATAGAATIVIDARSKQVVEVLATGGGSHMAAVTPDDSAVWVAAIGARQLVEIPLDLDADEPTFAVGRQLDVEDLLADVEADNGWAFPSYSPVCHQYSTDSAEAWVTLGPGWNEGGFFVLDLASGTVTDAWDPEEVKANCGVSVSDDRALANWSGQVVDGDDTPGEWYVFDVATKELLDTRDAEGNDAHGLRLTPDGSRYWMVNRESSNALVIDAETLEVVERYEDVAVTPDILDYSADGSTVYISQRGPAPRSGAIHAASGDEPGVRVVDAATGETLEVLQPPKVTTDGVVQNDVHGVAFRIRGDGRPLGDEVTPAALPTALPGRSGGADPSFTCHLPTTV
jgi:DNA-binding beta-propeller fold protein YncE